MIKAMTKSDGRIRTQRAAGRWKAADENSKRRKGAAETSGRMASELRVRGIIPVGLLRVRYVSAQGLQDPDRGIRSTDAI